MKPLRRWALAALVALAGLLLAGLGLLAGVWLWSGSDTSLAVALQQVQRVLPAGQSLQAREVSGSLRHGGRVGWLRWQQGGLSVEAHSLTVGWSGTALLRGELRLAPLRIERLVVEDHRPATPDQPGTPPTDLGLPLTADARVQIDTLQWVGASTQQVDQLALHYVFDGQRHQISEAQARFSANTYTFSGHLQAHGPLALAVKLGGTVDAPLPGQPEPLPLQAQVELTGALAGLDAELQLTASLTPLGTASQQQPAAARLSATLTPWQPQRITQAQARWHALDLAALWPQAPQTRLGGQATVVPQGSGWRASLQLDNTLDGPWNQHRLPLKNASAELDYSAGQWLLTALQAQGAGGSIQGRGQFGAPAQGDAPAGASAALWQGEAQIQRLNPAAIDTRLATGAISGTLSARQTPSDKPGESASVASAHQPIRFELALTSDTRPPSAGQPKKATAKVLQLQSLRAQGVWQPSLLVLDSLQLDAGQARLQGQLQLNTASLATRGQLSLTLPGLQAALNGHLAQADGQGTLSVQMPDAALASQWLARWPGLNTALANTPLRGNATLSAQWQGGWQRAGQTMQINAQLRAPQLDWRTPDASAATGSVQDLALDASGRLDQLQLSSQGKAVLGGQHISWQTRFNAGQASDRSWQASLSQLQLAWHDARWPAPWTLQIGSTPATTTAQPQTPITLRWQSTSAANTLTASAGSARLQGPAAGTVGIHWQPIRWSQPHTPARVPAKAAQWRSQGHIDGLPLTWLEALGKLPLANLGIGGDLLLAGSWDAAYTDTWHLETILERSAGDLHIRPDAGRAAVISAGMSEARLQVNLNGDQVGSSLRWRSARAGQALVAFSTQLSTGPSGWTWPANAPLGGSLQLQLPPMDAWSALAPPGWRLRGQVDSLINLSGTRALPQWDGTLRARDLALRSVVDGIDFSRGTLDARLQGQQLDITRFTLHGAGTPQAPDAGGQFNISGTAFWLPDTGQANLSQRIEMALQAKLSALRLSTRPDRRLVMSGDLTANLKAAQLDLRGNLSVDQALITLPEDSTPALGDDVRVRPSLRQASASSPAKPPAGSATNTLRITPDVSINLDLGPDFLVRGRGLQARLAGKLLLSAQGNAAPALTGNIRALDGTYQAYGQRLSLERSVLRFTGPIDNPALQILAIRPKVTQRVGVQVSGTALSPIVTLYSDPPLSDVEALSWLVLGRSGSAGGAEAALLQQAAMALLGGSGPGLSDNLSAALGLDEISFKGGESSEANGTASSASVTLGKRLSKDFYVAYESSLGSAMGVFYIFYDLTKQLTLRAQTGEQSAVDLIYTLRYD